MSLESYMNRRVLISSYQPYVVKTAKKFAQQLEWKPTVSFAGGYICWEAITRSLSALSFVISWFRPCYRVYFIHSEGSLQKIINSLKESINFKSYLVRAFAQLIENYGVQTAIGGKKTLGHNKVDTEINAKEYFDAITTLLN